MFPFLLHDVVCEEVCSQPNIFEEHLNIASRLTNPTEINNYLSEADNVNALEAVVNIWIKKLQRVRRDSIFIIYF